MGFAVAAAVLIVATGVAFAGGAAVAAWFDTLDRVHLAEEGALERSHARHATVLTIMSVTFTPADLLPGPDGRVDVTIRNNGTLVLWPNLVSVVMDGRLVDGNVTERRVRGTLHESLVWGPDDELRLRVRPVDAAPTAVFVVCENGASDRWTMAGG